MNLCQEMFIYGDQIVQYKFCSQDYLSKAKLSFEMKKIELSLNTWTKRLKTHAITSSDKPSKKYLKFALLLFNTLESHHRGLIQI